MAKREVKIATPGDEQQISDLAAAGLDASQIGRVMGLNITSVRSVLVAQNQRRAQTIQELLHVDFGKPLELSGDDWMITSDWHVPETDWRLVERMCSIARRNLVKQLVIGGDFFSQSQFSSFANLVPPVSWAQERDAARELLRHMLDVFENIWIVMGNHDRRLVKWADATLDEKDVFGMVITSNRVHVNKFAYCTLETSAGKWRVTHPMNYRQARGQTPALLADKLRMNVIAGHEHHTAMTYSPSGEYVAISIGGLYDAGKIAYVQLTDQLRPAMTPGFVMLRGGYPYLFGDKLTNWEAWGA